MFGGKKIKSTDTSLSIDGWARQLSLKNRFITDFKEKTELFNSFFSDQCSLLKNCSKLPTNLRYITVKRLRTINFTTDNIEKNILSLNPNKAHGHDNISMRMLKICGNTICKLLE